MISIENNGIYNREDASSFIKITFIKRFHLFGGKKCFIFSIFLHFCIQIDTINV